MLFPIAPGYCVGNQVRSLTHEPPASHLPFFKSPETNPGPFVFSLASLSSAIAHTVDFCIRHHAEDSILQPADPDAWNMFLRGETITRQAVVEIDIKRLDPNPIEIRRALSAPVHA